LNNSSDFQIIAPFYNDFDNFKLFVEKVETLNLHEKTFLLVDNGSTDNQMIEYFQKNNTLVSCELIRIEVNQGFGGGVAYASDFVSKDYVGWMPGNMKVNPAHVYELFIRQNLTSQNTLIKGKRVNRPKLDSIKTFIFGIVASIYFRTNLFDAGGTPNLVGKSFFDHKQLMPEDVSFDVYAYYYFRKLGHVVRPKISYTKRVHGKSKWQNGFSSELKMIINILGRKKTWDKIIKKNYK